MGAALTGGWGGPGGPEPLDLPAVQRYLHEHIPLSRHLGARVLEAGPTAVRLAAPLAPNLNHRGTAFGGSLSALAILSGWTWVFVNLRAEGFDGRIVIQSSSVDYLSPAEADFEAVCRAPSPERWRHFRETLEQRGRGRIELEADLTVGGRLVATFRGRYVGMNRAGEQGG